MKKARTLLETVIILTILVSFDAKAQITEAHRDSLNSVVEEYYRLNLNIFKSGSTVEDIDELFSLFTDDFTYVHPKYGGTYSRSDLYEGYKNNQANGAYNGSVVDFKIENKIVGLSALAIEKRFVEMKEGRPEEGKREMTLFEFRNGKISKIVEYW